MTGRDFENNGWVPKQCKVGTLYFKGTFFCRIEDGKAVLFDITDDMNPIGESNTIEEIRNLQMKSDLSYIRKKEKSLEAARKAFEENYGVKPDEHLTEGKVLRTMKLKVTDIINEEADDTIFTWRPPKDLLRNLTKGDIVTIKIIKDE